MVILLLPVLAVLFFIVFKMPPKRAPEAVSTEDASRAAAKQERFARVVAQFEADEREREILEQKRLSAGIGGYRT